MHMRARRRHEDSERVCCDERRFNLYVIVQKECIMVLWIMGLSGSGKSTVAKELSALFDESRIPNLILDGNHLREIFEESGYDRASRIALGMRYVDLAKILGRDRNIIIAANGMLKEVSQYARQTLQDYLEVYLQVPEHVLEQRDSKQIYSHFKSGKISNVGGLDLPVDIPESEIVITYNPTQSCRDIAQIIFNSYTKVSQSEQEIVQYQGFFGTKAQTLQTLAAKHLKAAEILPIWIIRYGDFCRLCGSTIQKHAKLLELLNIASSSQTSFIVRSSSKCEDTISTSNAGAFLSLLDVRVDMLVGSIDQVFKSYKKGQQHLDENEEVLIQPMAQDIVLSGVAFNYNPKTFAPYYVIEYSEQNTHAVTSGQHVKKFVQSHFASCKEQNMQKVIALFEELDFFFPRCPLDIEFGIDKEDILYLFQVRPLLISGSKNPRIIDKNTLIRIESKVNALLDPQPFLYGEKGILAVMPDWNPAEIIGIHPHPLAFSLYRNLITNEVWAQSRAYLGYNDVSNHPLIFSLAGYPYVDVRASFSSFIPNTLETKLAHKLTNFYLDRLRKNPQYHDKIEFEIVFCGYYFDTDKKLNILEDYGFNRSEIESISKSLKLLTNSILTQKPYEVCIEHLDTLREKREIILRSSQDEIVNIFWLLKTCKSYGTFSFAVLARMGFMAIRFLDSLVELGVLSQKDKSSFINSIDGVTSKFNRDLATLEKGVFLKKYGHLRPGTYDILSPSYKENFALYFTKNATNTWIKEDFKLSLTQMNTIESFLKEHGLEIGILEFFTFLRMGIMYREIAKFEFSKNLSISLDFIAQLGSRYGLTREDMSFCDIGIFFDAFGTSDNIERLILESIAYGRGNFDRQENIMLPPVIMDARDIYGFFSFESLPNFITQKRIQAEVVRLDSRDTQILENKIVCIVSADPGFDWIFSHNIAGLVTEFGGANSHMAIRANELGVPAVIGCGEKFDNYASARVLDIDCSCAKVEVLA